MCKPKKEDFGNLSKQKYLLDTCIWRDFYEDRFSNKGRYLGQYANDLFMKIIKNNDKIYFSVSLVKELSIKYNDKEIFDMLNILFLINSLIKIEVTKTEINEAKILSKKRNLPFTDCLCAVQARNHKAILISQDKHILINLSDITITKRPEDII